MPPSPTDRRLQRALTAGDATAVRHALETGSDPSASFPLTAEERKQRGTSFTSALGVALVRKQWESAAWLLAFGADPWKRETGESSARVASAWEALCIDGLDDDDGAIRWLASRRPADTRPADRTDGGTPFWGMLAKRASPRALLQALEAYQADRDGPVGRDLGLFLIDVALSKGAFPRKASWLGVLKTLHEIAPLQSSPEAWVMLAGEALACRNAPACAWILEHVKGRWWSDSTFGDPGWQLATGMARRGWGDELSVAVAAASPQDAWQLLLAAAEGTPEGFRAVLAAHPGNRARLVREPGPVLEAFTGMTARTHDLPAFLAILVEAGCDLGTAQADGRTPLQIWATSLAAHELAGCRIATRLATSFTAALVRAGAPFGDTEANGLRAHLPQWVARKEARALRGDLPKPEGSVNRPRF